MALGHAVLPVAPNSTKSEFLVVRRTIMLESSRRIYTVVGSYATDEDVEPCCELLKLPFRRNQFICVFCFVKGWEDETSGMIDP